MKRDKDLLIQSGNYKPVIGLGERTSTVVTKEILGKRKLDELRKELADLKNV